MGWRSPNPANDILNIEIEWDQNIEGNLYLFDIQGKLIKEIKIVGNYFISEHLDVRSFKAGTYFLLFVNDNNKIKTAKFVKAK